MDVLAMSRIHSLPSIDSEMPIKTGMVLLIKMKTLPDEAPFVREIVKQFVISLPRLPAPA
jgi:hypothetical protein